MDAVSDSDRRRRLRSLAQLMDNSIPLPGGYRIGIDPVLGLIPGIGDLLSAMLSVFIVNEARAMGAPTSIVLRMIGNVLIDTLIGSIPIVGDLFDAAFKANSRNLDLLDRYRLDPAGTRKSSRLFVVGASILSLLLMLVIISIPILLIVGIVKMF